MKLKTTSFIFRAMVVNRFLTLLILSFPLFATKIVAQESYLQKEIQLKQGAIRLDSALVIIKKQTGVVFSFNSKKLNTRHRIHIKQDIKTLSDFLELLKIEKKVSSKVLENYIVISALPKSPLIIYPEKVTEQEKNRIPNSLNNTISKDSVSVILKPDSTTFQEQPKQNTDTVALVNTQPIDTVLQRGVIATNLAVLTKPEIDSIKLLASPPINSAKSDTTKVVPPKRKKKNQIRKNLFIKPGVTLDESSFMGIIAQVGLPILYGSFSVNTNLETSHFRYGIGTSFKLNPNLRLHFVLNSGNVKRSGQFTDPYGDPYSIEVKSKLLRAGTGLEFRLQNKMSLQVIAQYNHLSTEYFVNNEPSSLQIFGEEGDQLFYAIKPPYTLSNTFLPTTSSNIKTWIGIQANLLYRINFKKR